jgi:uncharacterized lipoprotein
LIKRLIPITAMSLGAIWLLAACQSLDSLEAPVRLDDGLQSLAVPPDLTAPSANDGLHLSDAVRQRASGGQLKAFGAFKDFEKRAEYNEFLKWRAQEGISQSVDFSAFKAAKQEAQRALLSKRGVLTALDDSGQQLILINDTLDNSWNRVDTAVLNMGLLTLDITRATWTFRIHYDTRAPTGEMKGLKRLAFWLHEPVIYQLQLRQQNDIVVAGVYDEDHIALTDATANAFIARLAVQLKTFAREREQHVISGRKDVSGLSLHEKQSGRLQLTLPIGPTLAWKRLDQVLNEVGFSVSEKNSETLSFVIRYADPDAPDSTPLIKKLAFWNKDPITPASTYRVQLLPEGTNTVVDVINVEGNPSETGDRILSLIFERLKF